MSNSPEGQHGGFDGVDPALLADIEGVFSAAKGAAKMNGMEAPTFCGPEPPEVTPLPDRAFVDQIPEAERHFRIFRLDGTVEVVSGPPPLPPQPEA